jgi:hypothetical protein
MSTQLQKVIGPTQVKIIINPVIPTIGLCKGHPKQPRTSLGVLQGESKVYKSIIHSTVRQTLQGESKEKNLRKPAASLIGNLYTKELRISHDYTVPSRQNRQIGIHVDLVRISMSQQRCMKPHEGLCKHVRVCEGA